MCKNNTSVIDFFNGSLIDGLLMTQNTCIMQSKCCFKYRVADLYALRDT